MYKYFIGSKLVLTTEQKATVNRDLFPAIKEVEVKEPKKKEEKKVDKVDKQEIAPDDNTSGTARKTHLGKEE